MDLNWIDATDAAELVRRKEVTSLELVTASLSRMEEVNPTLNCVVERLDERALEAARYPRGDGSRFDGVPFLVKETAELAGTGWTAASYLTKDRRCATDSELMRRYLAGAWSRSAKRTYPSSASWGQRNPGSSARPVTPGTCLEAPEGRAVARPLPLPPGSWPWPTGPTPAVL